MFLRPLYAVKGLPSYFCYPRKKDEFLDSLLEKITPYEPQDKRGAIISQRVVCSNWSSRNGSPRVE